MIWWRTPGIIHSFSESNVEMWNNILKVVYYVINKYFKLSRLKTEEFSESHGEQIKYVFFPMEENTHMLYPHVFCWFIKDSLAYFVRFL